MKRFFTALMILFPVLIFSSENFQWNLKAGANNRIDDNNKYIVVDFKPYFSFYKFYAALDLEFQFHSDGSLKQDDWDNMKAIKQKIYTIGYGDPYSDPVFIKIGTLDNVSLGYGILVNHFRNDLYYPETRKLGIFASFDMSFTGASFFTEDTGIFKIFGGRFYTRPLYGLNEDQMPAGFKMLEIGISFVTDSDPYTQESKDMEFSFFGKDNPASQPVRAYALDMRLPIIKWEKFTLDNYIQYGDIQKIGAGVGYGFLGKAFKVLDFKAEIIYSWDGFLPNYFSSFYDMREVRSAQFTTAQNAPDGWGYIFGLYSNLFDNQLSLGAEFSGNKQASPHLLMYLNLKPMLLKRFFLKFTYDRCDIAGIVDAFNMNDLGNNTLIIFEMGYEITTNATISLRYIKSFAEENGLVTSNSITEIKTSLSF